MAHDLTLHVGRAFRFSRGNTNRKVGLPETSRMKPITARLDMAYMDFYSVFATFNSSLRVVAGEHAYGLLPERQTSRGRPQHIIIIVPDRVRL